MDWTTLLNSERPRTSTSPGDHREEFERDYDRSVFSTSVKRLQDKAQVFPLDPHDAVRTRLTHSLEVSTVARGLARKICRELGDKLNPGQDRQVEAIAATCGLLHDLGNPPFGHSGEDAIRQWFANTQGETNLRGIGANEQLVQDFLRFEGNAQTLRIVSKLQFLADYHGLNLTFGTLSALMKYSAPSHLADAGSTDSARLKPGYFASENELVARIRQATGTGESRNPITLIVEAADDATYSVADIEDGIKKGILSWAKLRGILESGDKASARLVEEILLRTDAILRAGQPTPLLDLPDDVFGSAFRTAAIGVFLEIASQAFADHEAEIMAGTFQKDLMTATAESAALMKLLKKGVGRAFIYNTPSTLKLELMGRKVIQDLLGLFWEGIAALPLDGEPSPREFAGKLGSLVSANYRRVFTHFVSDSELPEKYHRFQLLTDYICGMTDSFAQRLHAELTNG